MPWRQVLVALLCTGLTVQSSPCSWVEVLSSWSQGYKAVVKLQVEETVDHWDVGVQFSEPVINFEAWKGHVNKITDTHYTVSNTCYNNMVYSCQCFELPYLIRHDPMWEGNTTFKFNGDVVPACDPPSCDDSSSSAEANTSTATESPQTFTIQWENPMKPIVKCVVKGTTVIFNWTNYVHNVNQMTKGDWEKCTNFSNTEQKQGPYIFHASQIGVYYFASGVGEQCSLGNMTANITVANSCTEELINSVAQERIITRIDVSSIDQGTIKKFDDALKEVKGWVDARNFKNIGSYHGRPFMCNKNQTGITTGPNDENGCCIPHWEQTGRMILFIAWHRLYVYQMEQSLRIASKTGGTEELGMPYWDWTVPLSGGKKVPDLAQQGGWVNGPIKKGLNGLKGVDGTDTTSRNITTLNHTLMEKLVKTAFCRRDFKEFNAHIVIPHNAVHDFVGGDMATPDTASYDPIFYLHHSYVDLQYAYFQKLQKLRNLDIRFGHYDATKMYPFAGSSQPYSTSYMHSEGPQGLDYKTVFKYQYNNQYNVLKFQGMTPTNFYQNIRQLCHSEMVYAGSFLKETKITSTIDFNILDENTLTYVGSLYTFGSTDQSPDFSAPADKNVILYDVTESVDVQDYNLKFAVSKYTDTFGNDLPVDETFQPIIVYQQANSESYIFRLHVEQVHEYAPVMYGTIGHRVQFLKNGKVVSGDDNVKSWVGGTDDDSEAGKPVNGTVAIEYQEHKFIVNNEHGQTNITIGFDFYCFECNAKNFPVSMCSDIEIIPWNLNWLKENPTINITNCPGKKTIIASCDHSLSTVKKVDENDFDNCSNLWTKGNDGIYGLLVNQKILGTYYFANGKKIGTSQNYCDLGWKIAVNVVDCELN